MTDVAADLTTPQKAAVILVAMDKEHAAKLVSHFKPEDVRALMLASEGLNNVPQEVLDSLVDEFEQELSKGVGLLDSSGAIQSLVEEALTPEQLDELTVGPEAAKLALTKQTIWELLEKVDIDKLQQFIIKENSDAAGYILTKLPPKNSAAIIGNLDTDQRRAIVASMITTRPAIPEAVEMLEELVKNEFSRAIGANKATGSQKLVAGMLNELESDQVENLFEELADVVQPTNLQSVKSLMFRFEEILSLDQVARSTIFDQVSTELTTLALRDAEPDLIEAVLSSLGQRTRRMLEAELDTGSPATPEEVKDAQKQIASTVLSLASQGSISIPNPDADE